MSPCESEAQGIAFAIPVNDALETAARLMDQVVSKQVFHGINARTKYIANRPQLIVESVALNSPAAQGGN